MRRLLKLNDTAVIDRLVADYIRRGEHIDRSAYIAEHPELATRLAAALPRTDVAHTAGHATLVDRANQGDVTENIFGNLNGQRSLVGGDVNHYTIVSELGPGVNWDATVWTSALSRDFHGVACGCAVERTVGYGDAA